MIVLNAYFKSIKSFKSEGNYEKVIATRECVTRR